MADSVTERLQKLQGSLEEVNNYIEKSSKAMANLNKSALEGGDGFRALIEAADTAAESFGAMGTALAQLGSAIPGLGKITEFIGSIGQGFTSVIKSALNIVKIFDNVGRGMDSITGFSRNLNKSLFDSVSKFNGTFEAAKKYADFVISSAQDFATADFGFISIAKRLEATAAIAEAGIPLDILNESILSTSGSMDVLNTSILHSESLGISLTQYVGNLSHAITKQGLDAQQAAEQMAMFGDISETTGITTDKIAGSLQGLSGQFSKLGLTAEFGKPILEGFAKSLSSMGLGFENAIDLSETLSKALVGLTSNYSAAYVTFQRGGLDIGGGGGALGAGIGLRAKMAEARETGDQGKLALEMASALKETLTSFTGGQIVNVKQAAMDPGLQTTFYTQTKLLQDLYGIQDPAAQDRTLELLQQLEQATRAGDEELQLSLAQDLENAKNTRNETMGYEEKIAAETAATVAAVNQMNASVVEAVRLSSDSLAVTLGKIMGEDLFKTSSDEMGKVVNKFDPQEKMLDFGALNDQVRELASANSNFTDIMTNLDLGGDVKDAIQSTTMTVRDDGVVAAITELAQSFKELSSYLLGNQESRSGPPLGR